MSTGPADRHLSLDAIRGIAVMGILLLNAFSFATPDAAYVNPLAWGGTGAADIAAWATSFVLFEGKMRALFSLLFGASMALVVDRVRGGGQTFGADRGAAIHFRRLFWLLVFGLAHHLLVWEGDILVQYALFGMIAYPFLARSNRILKRWAIGMLVASCLIHAGMMAGSYALKAAASAPAATAATKASYAELLSGFSQPGSADVREDIATYRSDYPTILSARAKEMPAALVALFTLFGFETLGLMLLGVVLLRNGFLTGAWEAGRYRRWAIRAYLIGIPPLIALAAWNHASGFDTHHVFSTFIAWAEPFRYPVMIGHAALAMLLLARFRDSALVTRIAAVGRAAFTNYLGTSLVMTSLFYGYGAGLFGHLGRAETHLVILAVWGGMLAWSLPWLRRYRYGPLEWLWRSLSRGEAQPMERRVEAG